MVMGVIGDVAVSDDGPCAEFGLCKERVVLCTALGRPETPSARTAAAQRSSSTARAAPAVLWEARPWYLVLAKIWQATCNANGDMSRSAEAGAAAIARAG